MLMSLICSCAAGGADAGLRPVAWFRFFGKTESAAAARQLGESLPTFSRRFEKPMRYSELPGVRARNRLAVVIGDN